MFLKHIDLTTALRPSYLPDEVLLFVQDNVGLYEGYVNPSKDRRRRGDYAGQDTARQDKTPDQRG